MQTSIIKPCFVSYHIISIYEYRLFHILAVRHNTPVDAGCSALAFVPEELKTQELCLEAIRHDYLIPVFWDCNHTVTWDYAAAINFVPKKFRTPELCFEALIHHPSSMPGFFHFVDNEFSKNYVDGNFAGAFIQPKFLTDILNSSDLFLEALKRVGMPDEYNEDALKFFEKVKSESC